MIGSFSLIGQVKSFKSSNVGNLLNNSFTKSKHKVSEDCSLFCGQLEPRKCKKMCDIQGVMKIFVTNTYAYCSTVLCLRELAAQTTYLHNREILIQAERHLKTSLSEGYICNRCSTTNRRTARAVSIRANGIFPFAKFLDEN